VTKLIEVERTYVALAHLLLEKVAVYVPASLDDTRHFLEMIDHYPIQEKTLYVAQLLERLTNSRKNKQWDDTKTLLRKQEVSQMTILQLEKYLK